jgi:polysaccharide export outer membrane protein
VSEILVQAPGGDVTGIPADPGPDATPNPAPLPGYRVGAGDVLSIVVFGHDDLALTPTIQPSGLIVIPLLREVPVAGLTVPEIQRKLTNLLEKDYLVDPQVNVEVREYQSQYVIVLGEVNDPGRKPLRGQTRLIDALVEAGGFKPNASADVTITRTDGTFEEGDKTLHVRLSGSEMTPQDEVNLSIPLRNGDVISALGQSRVTVQGEVNRPGRYLMDGDLTITGAIAIAGGRTRFGSDNVEVRRFDPSGELTEPLSLDLNDIRKGKEPDLKLLPGDVVTVPRKRF